MKRLFFFFLLFMFAGSSVMFGLDVDKSELDLTRNTSVEFINYEGPHSKIETLQQIMAIGIFLGESIDDEYSTASYAGKYRVIHAIGSPDDSRLNADIFIVLSDAEVDHIRNMRYMIAGFLMAAYEYQEADALLLAEFITVYNAVYRSKMDFFKEKYKSEVTRNLHTESAGISTVYTEWAGNTEMLIPLTKDASQGGLGSLDTDALTDEEVVEELRTQPDLGLDSRKDIVELKEREIEEKQEEIEQERDTLDDDQQRIAAEKQRIADEQARIEKEKEKAESDAEKARIAREEADLARQTEAVAEEEEEAQEQEEELAEKEQEQAERIDRIQQEREDIATDERELTQQDAEDESTEVASATGARQSSLVLTYLEIRDIAGEALGRVVHIDAANGAVIRASTLNSIRNQRIETIGSNFVVVAGTTTGQGAVRLMTLDTETLETESEGSEDIYEGSFLLVDGTEVYAVTGGPDGWFLGRFDSRLAADGKSEIQIFENTTAAVSEDALYVQGTDGLIHILSKEDLTEVGVVR
ncbi:MAG: hypothetical protein HN368_17810 [Spirochaetales bacterium]|jgi:hypothetical protein|nr:hypothetical protein [Spirochaetales bacterium]